MAKNALPMFFRDPQTGFMKELAPNELSIVPLAPGEKRPAAARVLVADDDESDRLLTIWQLGDAWPVKGELVVECATDGTQALEKIRSHPYALVVLDWSMPRTDGAEVLRAMRERDLRIPVVVLSDQRREDIAHELDSMTAAFVSKAELDAHSFRNAIAVSMLLQAMPRSAGTGWDTKGC
jgi:CheY-like chemotaxis protein